MVPIGPHGKSEYFYNKESAEEHIYEFSGALNFVSAENLKLPEKEKKTDDEAKLINQPIILSMGKVTNIDIVGANALIALTKKRDIYFVDASPEVKQFLPDAKHFATLVDAVSKRSEASY